MELGGIRIGNPHFNQEVNDLLNQGDKICRQRISLHETMLNFKETMDFPIDTNIVGSNGDTWHNPIDHAHEKSKSN